jgi:hypothetical protein
MLKGFIMTRDANVLEIEADMTLDDVVALHESIKNRLHNIESVEIKGKNDPFVSSSLFALLFSIKKSKPSLIIPLIDRPSEIAEYGIFHWNVS